MTTAHDRRSLIHPATDQAIASAVQHLTQGRLIGLPTETVYGLAARGDQAASVQKIYSAKGRPATNPLILHVDSFAAAMKLFSTELCDLQQRRLQRFNRHWPGPLTVVGPKHADVLDEVTAGASTVAVRIPSHPVARQVLEQCPFPVAAPSANRSNYVSPTLPEHVVQGLADSVEMVLDGGACDVGLESTIVFLGDADQPPRILRAGCLSAQTLSRSLGESVVEFSKQSTEPLVASPGQMSKHYSPRTPMRLVQRFTTPPENGETFLRLSIGPLKPSEELNRESAARVVHRALSKDGDLRDAAANLYAVLRWADEQSFDRIEFLANRNESAESTETSEASNLFAAIMDRVRRASQTTQLPSDAPTHP